MAEEATDEEQKPWLMVRAGGTRMAEREGAGQEEEDGGLSAVAEMGGPLETLITLWALQQCP